jgi:diguanylate cyclase (GGDEF)-like protein
MNKKPTLDRYITIVFFITIISVIFTSYFTFKEIINTHHQKQQNATIPLFALINSEIIHPLSIAKFISHDQFIIEFAEQETIDKKRLLRYLKGVTSRYKMPSFIALDKHNLMIDSNNKQTGLTVDEAEWYQRLKNVDQNEFTDIGNAEDPHLYFDIKLYSKLQEFLGFVGIAVDLNYFEEKFAEFQNNYGFELIFTNEDNFIILSSTALMKTASHHRSGAKINIDTLPWYKGYVEFQSKASTDEKITRWDTQDLFVSKIPIKDLGWTLYITSPKPDKQMEYWKIFITRLGVFLLITLFLCYLFIKTVSFYKSSILRNAEIDYLTQLPNRSYITREFETLSLKYSNVSVVLADIDHFKRVNDNYGHPVGDKVLVAIAKTFSENLRQDEMIGRWGGEEFIMVLPDTNADQAFEITERIRKSVESLTFTSADKKESFSTTISFGIKHADFNRTTLKKIIDESDKALYSAKNTGRNKVVVFENNQ